MEVFIRHNLLSDSPYCEKNKELFPSSHNLVADLVADIQNGNPTCYLISGYRGAGKSSFIYMLETEIKRNEPSDESREIIFIHTNFSNYQSQTYLLRRLIRGLYLKLKETTSYKASTENTKGVTKEEIKEIDDLYEKTFYDTSHNFMQSRKEERVTVLNIDLVALCKFLLPVLLLIMFGFNVFLNLFTPNTFVNIIGILLSLSGSIWGIISLKKTFTETSQEQSEYNRKSLYDDDIADHHFVKILTSLKEKYNLVFVLDELDKVDDNDIETLLKEMKPYLVSGLATFIAVAGQHLFYKYAKSILEDDAILSSIFSKSIHISLLSREELQNIFLNKILEDAGKYSTEQIQFLKQFADYLVFQSKRVPRKFISLIREQVTWHNGKAMIQLDETARNFSIYTKVNDIIDRIDDREIATHGFDPAMRDYFVMQLFLKSHTILFNKDQSFSLKEILTSE